MSLMLLLLVVVVVGRKQRGRSRGHRLHRGRWGRTVEGGHREMTVSRMDGMMMLMMMCELG